MLEIIEICVVVIINLVDLFKGTNRRYGGYQNVEEDEIQ